MASRYTALVIKIDNFIGNMQSLSLNISKNKVSTLLISFHQSKGNTLVHSFSKFKKNQRWFVFQFVINQTYIYGVKTGEICFCSQENCEY